MASTRLWVSVALGAFCLADWAGAQTPAKPPPPPPRATEIPTEGFWPTAKMMDRIIDRIVDDMADHYKFDDEQTELTRELLKQRIPTWLNQNRAEIQTLTNEFFEAQLDDKPPSVEAVTQWSQRVLPLVGEFAELMTDTTDSMREYMTDEQQVQLDAELAAFQTGIDFVTNKLSVWASGGYDPESEWIPHGPERAEREREQDQLLRESMDQAREQTLAAESGVATPTSAPAAPPDEWTAYTLAFIERYQLNVEQRQKAMVYLAAAREQRDRYLRGKASELERVKKMLADAETEPARQEALAAFEKLNAPVQRRFQQLKDKLNTLPTRAQRRAAALADQQDQPKPTDKTTTNQQPQQPGSRP